MQDAALSSTLVPLTVAHLDALLAIEVQAHSHPWTRGNVIDALAAGYYAQGLWSAAVPGGLWGYCIAMPGVTEAHLLNITVAPAYQGQGGARRLLLALDRRHGYVEVGVRKRYYALADGAREDAILMSLNLWP